jgi:hypothetical protein
VLTSNPGSHSAFNPQAQTVTGPALVQPAVQITHQEPAIARTARADTPPQPAVSDTFSALDAPSAMPTTTWLHAGPRHAEAGYLDPVLGWVGVRAESAGASVHAAIITGSADAARALDTHLAGLNSFMAEHHGQSSTVTIAPSGQQHFSDDFNQSGQGTGQQQAPEDHPNTTPAPLAVRSNTPIESASESQTTYTPAGAHISVVA